MTVSVSVIIAVYNGSETIVRAIDSVIAQTCPPHEIIVVDDGSVDDTANKIKQFGEKVRYIYQANAGVSVARNKAVELAEGEWLAFLDADDWYYSDRLASHVSIINESPDLDFLTGDFDYVQPDGHKIRRSMESTEVGKMLLDKMGDDGCVTMEGAVIGKFIESHFGDTHTLMMPRSTFLTLGGYPSGVAVCEDVNLLIRLAACSQRIGVYCRPMAAYVIHDKSATRSDPVRAQQQTLQALLPLKYQLIGSADYIKAGLKGTLRIARLDLAYSLLSHGRRWPALRSVLPLLLERPGWQSIRDVLSIMKG